MSEVDGEGGTSGNGDKLTTELPIARVKRIMKLGEGVKMVSNEAAVKLAYCVDLLIGDITKRAWTCATQNHRRTFLKWDIQEALIDAEHLDFLIDIVPTNETRQQKKDKKPSSSQENFAHHMIAKMNIAMNKTVYIHVMRDMHIQPVQPPPPPPPPPAQQYIRIQPAQPTYQFIMNPDPSQCVLYFPQPAPQAPPPQ